MNTIQLSIKRTFGQSFDFLVRNVLKVVPNSGDMLSVMPVQHVISDQTSSNFPTPEHQDMKNEVNTLSMFEAGLNAIDADLYNPFMMHMEGYRNCEIADYLTLTENEVAMKISKVRDLLQMQNGSVVN